MSPPGLIIVDAAAYYAAARALSESARTLSCALQLAVDGLARCESMAGNDEAGASWGHGYDATVRAALASTNFLIAALDNHSALLVQAGRNHALADAMTVPARIDLPRDLPATRRIETTNPPSAVGDQGSGLRAFAALVDAVGMPCPNGDTDLLRAAADIWARSASDVGSDTGTADALEHLNQVVSRESIFAIEDVDELRQLTRGVRDTCHQLADSCREHEQDIQSARDNIEPISIDLGVEIGVTAAVSVFAAFISFGASTAVGGAQVARAASTAARLIRPIIDALRARALLRLPAERAEPGIAHVSERARAILDRSRHSSDGPELPAAPMPPRRTDPPALHSAREQLERKFKHAEDFGVQLPRSSAGFDNFERALTDFVRNPATEHLDGIYRGEACTISVDPNSHLAVVQRVDGSFWTGWRLSDDQLASVLKHGRLF